MNILFNLSHAFRMLTCKDYTMSSIAQLSMITSAKDDLPVNNDYPLDDSLSRLYKPCKNIRGNSWWDNIREVTSYIKHTLNFLY